MDTCESQTVRCKKEKTGSTRGNDMGVGLWVGNPGVLGSIAMHCPSKQKEPEAAVGTFYCLSLPSCGWVLIPAHVCLATLVLRDEIFNLMGWGTGLHPPLANPLCPHRRRGSSSSFRPEWSSRWVRGARGVGGPPTWKGALFSQKWSPMERKWPNISLPHNRG